jgi:hypothetical protein
VKIVSTKQKLNRQQSAEKMFSDGVLAQQTEKDRWLVPSRTGSARYQVSVDFDIWHCDCDDMRYRGAYTLCSHILFVQMLQTLKAAEEQIEVVV